MSGSLLFRLGICHGHLGTYTYTLLTLDIHRLVANAETAPYGRGSVSVLRVYSDIQSRDALLGSVTLPVSDP